LIDGPVVGSPITRPIAIPDHALALLQGEIATYAVEPLARLAIQPIHDRDDPRESSLQRALAVATLSSSWPSVLVVVGAPGSGRQRFASAAAHAIGLAAIEVAVDALPVDPLAFDSALRSATRVAHLGGAVIVLSGLDD